MRILGIETSCDETAAAVVEVKDNRFSVLSNVVASQIKIHAKTGGVVPEVAARAHVATIIPVVQKALEHARKNGETKELKSKISSSVHKSLSSYVDYIAVTSGPGLMTSLLVGVEVARTLSALWKKPLIAVNHLAGHVYANWLPSTLCHSEGASRRMKNPVLKSAGSFARLRMTEVEFPALCLIVSGGHTELVLMRRHMDFKIIGSTRDDAAGEAFDKVAKMLGLPYPGGPTISRESEKWKSEIRNSKFETNLKFQLPKFPRPMITSPDFDFSFSGLKTSVLYYIKNLEKQNRMRPHTILLKRKMQEICYEFQEAAVEVLVAKTIRAAKQYKVKTILLGGGVAANIRLREQLVNAVNCELSSVNCILPAAEYTGDNAAMIAAAGYFMALKKDFTPWEKIDVDPNWELGQKFHALPR
ncbi:MAG: tRNA (adenosine(37)-N6)-threonylcarbamoyltransferase complex transferase subunit TsaD [bacterium]|nr:tRNA (adenosine(37)-N6)-threonylcarbamoyltransferase complex transferase subunit TsaD [bacterium]